MFQEILPKVLKGDLKVVLSSPKHLELFLLAKQRVPAELEKLMGPVHLFSHENIPRCEGSGWLGSPWVDPCAFVC
jgi:DNA polymerase phi